MDLFGRFSFYLLLAIIPNVFCDCNETEEWMRQYSFGQNGTITAKWNFTADELTMVMIGKTKGWIALGFATNKSLEGADLVFGWIDSKDGKTYLQDRHGDVNNQSLVDNENSYTLISGKENETFTIICWKRKLDTCDNQDIPISFSTLRVFWAFGNEDPPDVNFKFPSNLGPNRGIQSLRIASYDYVMPHSPDIKTMDFVANNAPISPSDTGTVYWCSHFTIPKADRKSHVVSAEPIIQKENTDIVHHYLLYECPENFMEKWGWTIGSQGYSCFEYTKFPFQDLCITLLYGWAIGGTSVNMPPDIGYPLHSTDKPKYYMLQTHYNVQNMKTERRDNSGLRIHYTFNLRKNDGNIIAFGVNVSPFQLVPPGQKDFSNVGICDDQCTTSTIPETGIHVYGVVFHAHLAARKLRLRIIRKGVELEPIVDESYDFDYQQLSFLTKEFNIMPGDKLITECVYDTSSRNYTTVGAFGTFDEMCLIFLHYTPSANLTWCVSSLDPLEVMNMTEIGALLPLPKFCWGPECESIYSAQGVPNLLATVMFPMKNFGMKLGDYLKAYEWSKPKMETLQQIYYKDQKPLCKSKDISFNSTDSDFAVYPTGFKEYKRPDPCKAVK